ncbi:hypothetical protein V6N13_042792 [Hibiscus sabdariffa]
MSNLSSSPILEFPEFSHIIHDFEFTSDEEEAGHQGKSNSSLVVKTPTVNVDTGKWEVKIYHVILEVVTPKLLEVEIVVVEEINEEDEKE